MMHVAVEDNRKWLQITEAKLTDETLTCVVFIKMDKTNVREYIVDEMMDDEPFVPSNIDVGQIAEESE